MYGCCALDAVWLQSQIQQRLVRCSGEKSFLLKHNLSEALRVKYICANCRVVKSTYSDSKIFIPLKELYVSFLSLSGVVSFKVRSRKFHQFLSMGCSFPKDESTKCYYLISDMGMKKFCAFWEISNNIFKTIQELETTFFRYDAVRKSVRKIVLCHEIESNIKPEI